MIKEDIQDFLGIEMHRGVVEYNILETFRNKQFDRYLISYSGSESDEIRAYLFIPLNLDIVGAVLVHHQHHGERHLGKSEVSGMTGDPFQHFCPELAKVGIVALAPDSICFEDRRTNMKGIEPAENTEDDWLQHYNEMCYRLLKGKTLMKKVIDDSSIAISILSQLKDASKDKIGILGHSYGGNTAIFHSPFDERIKYTCSSGAVCSYQNKFSLGTGIEMAEVIPGFSIKYDIEHLLQLIAPRELLIMSATEDKYSKDAKALYQLAVPAYDKVQAKASISHKQFKGEHRLEMDRFNYIISWFQQKFSQ